MPYFDAINDECECEAESLRAYCESSDSIIDAAAYGTEAESLYAYTYCRRERADDVQTSCSYRGAGA